MFYLPLRHLYRNEFYTSYPTWIFHSESVNIEDFENTEEVSGEIDTADSDDDECVDMLNDLCGVA